MYFREYFAKVFSLSFPVRKQHTCTVFSKTQNLTSKKNLSQNSENYARVLSLSLPDGNKYLMIGCIDINAKEKAQGCQIRCSMSGLICNARYFFCWACRAQNLYFSVILSGSGPCHFFAGLRHRTLQGDYTGCNTRNGQKLSSSQARARSGHQFSCCLVYLHFLCDILFSRTLVSSESDAQNTCLGNLIRSLTPIHPYSLSDPLTACNRRGRGGNDSVHCFLQHCMRSVQCPYQRLHEHSLLPASNACTVMLLTVLCSTVMLVWGKELGLRPAAST